MRNQTPLGRVRFTWRLRSAWRLLNKLAVEDGTLRNYLPNAE
jgi:hypothetical protein